MAYPKHEQAVKDALADVGVREEPPGSNSGRRVREYQDADWLPGTAYPWCVSFCIWAATKAGFKLPYLGAGAYAYLDWAKKAGWAVPAAGAIPGDFVVFNVGAGHMAMLREKVKGGTVRTVDGNVSDQVALRERPLSTVRGFVHLPEQPAIVKSVRPPVFEVVTSESGHKVIYVSGSRAISRRLARILGRYPSITIRRRHGR